ncbi:hypothetical protein RHMOL_Rhmol03G0031300 [Rhododendron molle]|uniref:Uncharacterized protein n=1 Tax=Rhododendron molle TaxID=49168 RepID=A0ACC0P9P3_RHOML|nr:hypothetical protein RHMOL_Rhmol03G0031300 [Rhododendron molle]
MNKLKKQIFKGWNCIGSHKLNAVDIGKWRWKPRRCDLLQFDPLQFLKSFRDTNIGVPLGSDLKMELAGVLGMVSVNAIQIWFFADSLFIHFL